MTKLPGALCKLIRGPGETVNFTTRLRPGQSKIDLGNTTKLRMTFEIITRLKRAMGITASLEEFGNHYETKGQNANWERE